MAMLGGECSACCGGGSDGGCCACSKEMISREAYKVGNPDSIFKLGFFTLSYSLSADGTVVDSWDGITGEPPGLVTSGSEAGWRFGHVISGPAGNFARVFVAVDRFRWLRYGYLFLFWSVGTGEVPWGFYTRTLTWRREALPYARFHCGGAEAGGYIRPTAAAAASQLEVLGGDVGRVSGPHNTRTSPTDRRYGILTSSTVSVNGMPPTPEETERHFKPSDGFQQINSVEFVSEFSENLWNSQNFLNINPTSWRIVLRAEFLDPRIYNLETCYTDTNHDADPPSGYAIGLCRKPVRLLELNSGRPDDPCVISKACECADNELEASGAENYDVFLPDGSLCNCCCYPNQTSIESVEGRFTVDNPTHTFGQNSPFAGLPAKVFVTDPTDTLFGEGGVRVVIVPAEYVFSFTRIIAEADASHRGSFTRWEYSPAQCGEAYAWAEWVGVQCRETAGVAQQLGQHNYYSSRSELSVPVYRSVELGNSDGSVQDEIEAGLNAGCDSVGWDWNFWVDTKEATEEQIVSGEHQLVWETSSRPNADQATAEARYPKWFLDIVTTDGAETLSGKYTQSLSYNENDCQILRTETFGTGEGFSVPIVSGDCWPTNNPLP